MFVLGLSSIISQVVVLRELTVSFYGNELFIGVVLASWLFWVAVGSGLLGKLLNRSKKDLIFLISLHFLVGILFFLEIFLIRVLKTWIGFPGEIPNLVTAGLSAFLIPAPLCLILGLWWTTATKIFCGFHKKAEVSAVNRAYFIETLGFILGGVAFTFCLVYLQEFAIASVLMLLNLAGIILLLSGKKGYAILKVATLFLFFIFILLSYSPPLMTRLNEITQSFRFKNQTLVKTDNSPHGNIAVTKTNQQYNFYESGLLLATTENVEFSEKLIHLSLLQHPSPKKVLLLGGGLNGGLIESLKHEPEKVYYLELDRKLINVSLQYIPPEFKKALDNPKVEVISTDGIYFLARTQEKFDVIICNLPDPSTALINRFYTKEFFEKAKKKLNPNGILATYLTFSPSTPGKNLENLNASIFKTLKKVFQQVIVLPEETNFFLASGSKTLTYNPELVIQRFEQRNIETKFLTKEYITYRLSNDRIEKTFDLFGKNTQVEENKDSKPVAYFYQILFWLDRFYPKFSNFFKSLSSAFWFIFAGIFILLTLFLVKQKKRLRKNLSAFSVAVAGLSLMALEILIIFSYQIAIGYLYHRLALLITALMAGMAVGIWYGNRAVVHRANVKPKNLIKFHLLLIIFCAILPLVLGSTKEIIFLACAVIAGFLGAAIFPLANQIYLSQQQEPHKKTGATYSANLLGSCFGALLPGLILIPVFGVFPALVFIALANGWILLIMLLRKDRGE